MKRLFLPLFLGFVALHARNLVFTDATLKRTLLASPINANKDQEISEEEAWATDSLSLGNYDFDFLSDPYAEEYSYSDLYAFKNLQSLTIKDDNIQFKRIDFIHFPKLQKLDMALHEMVIANLASLNSLQSLNIEYNGDTLDLSPFTKLEKLKLESGVRVLKLAPTLTYISISSLNVDGLDLSDVNHIKYFEINNAYSLESLDLSHSLADSSKVVIFNTSISSLTLPDSKIMDLYIYRIDAMEDLDLSNCMMDNSKLYLNGANALRNIKMPNNHRISVLTVQGLEELKTLDLSESMKVHSSLSMDIFPKLTSLDLSSSKLASLSINYLPALTTLDLSNCMEVNGSVTISNLNAATSISMPKVPINNLRVSRMDNLDNLDLSPCLLSNCTVSVENCPRLENLTLPNNKQIYDLSIQSTGLKTLDLTDQTLLKRLTLRTSLQNLSLPTDGGQIRFFNYQKWTDSPILNLSNLHDLDTLIMESGDTEFLYLPSNNPIKVLQLYNNYSYMPLKNIVGLENQTHLSSLNLANIINKIDISRMEALKYLTLYSDSSSYHKFICVKDSNQVKGLDLTLEGRNFYFVNCHEAPEDCRSHITPTSICDDFKDATPDDGENNEYAVPTEKWAWLYNEPSPYKKANMGAFWVLPGQSADFISSKTRNNDGSLTFHITKTSDLVQPMMLSFGNYANGNEEGKFTIDLSKNAVVSFEIKDIKNGYSNLIVELEDIHGNVLSIDNSAPEFDPQSSLFYEHFQIGIPYSFADNFDNKINGIGLNKEGLYLPDLGVYSKVRYLPNLALGANGPVHKFHYDFKQAICGKFEKTSWNLCCVDSLYRLVPKRETQFDYKHVALVKLLRTTNEADGLKGTDYSFTISNFKMGADDHTVGIETEVVQSYGDEIFKVYDMMGAFVAEGAWKQLQLNPRQLYILKSSERTFKVIVTE